MAIDKEEALSVLNTAATSQIGAGGNVRPIALYVRASLLEQTRRPMEAAGERCRARAADRRWCFPSGHAAQDALQSALKAEANDWVAASLLGMLLYGPGRREEAVELWDRAISLGFEDAVLHRNGGLAAYNVLHDDARAWEHYERARALAPENARLLFQQDQLAERLAHSTESRLDRLERASRLVASRDGLTVQLAKLLLVIEQDGRDSLRSNTRDEGVRSRSSTLEQ